jgi:hypothetical protein
MEPVEHSLNGLEKPTIAAPPPWPKRIVNAGRHTDLVGMLFTERYGSQEDVSAISSATKSAEPMLIQEI